MKMALASMAGFGDIFTDSDESAASVAAAENLAVLAGKLAGQDIVVTTGFLKADDEQVCEVQVCINGDIFVEIPEGFDTSGRTWTITLKSGQTLPVAMFAGECGDDEDWVIDDAEAFYDAILAETTT